MWKRKSSKPSKTVPFTPTEEQIRAKAYELWQQRGAESSDEKNWNDAIRLLQREHTTQKTFRPILQLWQWTGFREKKLWDFMQLLLVPALLAIGGFWLNQQAAERQDVLNQQRREQDQQLANDKANQDTLVKYLDQMADSLKDGLLQAKPGSEKFIIAQARTVTVLQSLDRRRQQLVVQFLRASGLSQTSKKTTAEKLAPQDRVLLYQAQMEKANLANSDLSGSVFIGANLQGANLSCYPPDSKEPNQCSDLRLADFRGASFTLANLSGAMLNGAILRDTFFISADLRDAILFDANLSRASFTSANLSGANLRNAILDKAEFLTSNLSRANLSEANLRNAILFDANLSGAIFLTTDVRDSKGLIQQQLEGEHQPLLCNVALPEGVKVNPNRDCDLIPHVLHERYPDQFKTIEEAQAYVNEARKKKWD